MRKKVGTATARQDGDGGELREKVAFLLEKEERKGAESGRF